MPAKKQKKKKKKKNKNKFKNNVLTFARKTGNWLLSISLAIYSPS